MAKRKGTSLSHKGSVAHGEAEYEAMSIGKLSSFFHLQSRRLVSMSMAHNAQDRQSQITLNKPS